MIEFNSWIIPTEKELRKEYKSEYIHQIKPKYGDIFPTLQDWYDSIGNTGEVIRLYGTEIMKRFKRRETMEDLIKLIRKFRSYPKYRNEATVKALYNRFLNNEEIYMPIIYRDKESGLIVVSGNTRINISYMLGIKPEVVCFEKQEKNNEYRTNNTS